MAWFLRRNYWSSLDHDLMVSICEKAISFLAGNLNSSYSYLITAVAKVIQTESLAEKGNNSFHNQLFLCCDKVGSKDFIMIGLAIFLFSCIKRQVI